MRTTYCVEVTGYGSEGDGISRLPDGRVAFIRHAARGDILEIELSEEKARSTRGEIVRIVSLSPHRIDIDCDAYPECGGCAFRHISYEEELRAKLNRVNDALLRIGGFSHLHSEIEILSTGQINGYRNRAVLHSDGYSCGYYAYRSHEIVPIEYCFLLKDDLNTELINLPKQDAASLSLGWNNSNELITEALDGLEFEISGFFQVNTKAAELLYSKAREYAGLQARDTLIDMYCGVGSLTLYLGRDCGYALGVEINQGSIEAARRNAIRNRFTHIDFVTADVGRWDSPITNPDCITFNPPRKGLSNSAIQKVLALAPKRLVYISCDPATLARDLRLLETYEIQEVCAIDMFPRTANVECCVKLQRKV